jgi:hypothetical protein
MISVCMLHCSFDMSSSLMTLLFHIYLNMRCSVRWQQLGPCACPESATCVAISFSGSERASKTGIDGTTLREAKYINLSLHYLEQASYKI